MSGLIHVTSIVEAGARLHDEVVVGPFCHIGPGVEIGPGSILQSHVAIGGLTRIGSRARIFPFTSVGGPSQDLKAALAEGALDVGEDCVIREGVTINSGVGAGTRIGARCALLANAHVGHDCQLGEGVVLANNVLLGGHVEIGDHASVGGGTGVHQFVRIGAHAFVGGVAGVEGDVIPFGLAGGNRANLFGLNLVGLRRRGFSQQQVARLREAYRQLFAGDVARPLSERVDAVDAAFQGCVDVAQLVAFLRAPAQRPLCGPRMRGATA